MSKLIINWNCMAFIFDLMSKDLPSLIAYESVAWCNSNEGKKHANLQSFDLSNRHASVDQICRHHKCRDSATSATINNHQSWFSSLLVFALGAIFIKAQSSQCHFECKLNYTLYFIRTGYTHFPQSGSNDDAGFKLSCSTSIDDGPKRVEPAFCL